MICDCLCLRNKGCSLRKFFAESLYITMHFNSAFLLFYAFLILLRCVQSGKKVGFSMTRILTRIHQLVLCPARPEAVSRAKPGRHDGFMTALARPGI
jgi:hypothetical protein